MYDVRATQKSSNRKTGRTNNGGRPATTNYRTFGIVSESYDFRYSVRVGTFDGRKTGAKARTAGKGRRRTSESLLSWSSINFTRTPRRGRRLLLLRPSSSARMMSSLRPTNRERSERKNDDDDRKYETISPRRCA